MLELTKPLKAYYPNESIAFCIQLPDSLATRELQLRVRRPLFSVPGTVTARTVSCGANDLRLQEPGYYEIELLAGETRLDAKGLVVLPAHPIPQSKRMGMGIYGDRHSNAMFADMVRLCAYVGIGTVREDFKWEHLEPERGRLKWDDADRIVDVYKKHEIEVLAVISGSPPWSSAEPATHKWCDPPADPQDYVAFVKKLAQRYWPAIRRYEVWNEPDWHLKDDYANSFAGSAEQYSILLQKTYDALKAMHEDVDVHNGGLSLCSRDADFLQDCIDCCGRICFDTLNLHAYASWDSIDRQRSIVARYSPAVETWIGESGMAAAPGANSAADKTTFLINRLTASILKDIKRFIWYDFRNDGFDVDNNEHNFGLITHDGYALPALQAYMTCSGLLGSAEPAGEWDFGEGCLCTALADGDRWVFVVRAQPESLGCAGFRNVQLVDAYGCRRDVGDRPEHIWFTWRPLLIVAPRDADPKQAFAQRVQARGPVRTP